MTVPGRKRRTRRRPSPAGKAARKESSMKRLRVLALLVAGLALAAIAAGTALAHSAAFSASYSGTVTEKVSGQDVTAIAKGNGKGTVIGKSTINGIVKATTANPPCSPFSGPGTIVGPAGKLKVKVLPTSRGCAASAEDKNNISVAGTAKVIGGTGKYRTAKGSLRFSGHYDRSAGTFTVKLRGTLKY
jgi:hypothetical protein